MDLPLIQRLIEDDDPLQTLYESLTGEIWTAVRFEEARRRGDLLAYLREGEHTASTLEQEVYDIYEDVYRLLECKDARRDRVAALHQHEEYTLLLIDGVSLREMPLIQDVLNAHDLACQVDFALAPLPTETSEFARRHYNASGPSDIANHAHRYPFAFRHVTVEGWTPDFSANRTGHAHRSTNGKPPPRVGSGARSAGRTIASPGRSVGFAGSDHARASATPEHFVCGAVP
jgi:hypothetical protein